MNNGATVEDDENDRVNGRCHGARAGNGIDRLPWDGRIDARSTGARLPSHRRTGARDAIRGETGALLTEVGLIMRQALDLTRQLGTVALLAILTVGFGLGPAAGASERQVPLDELKPSAAHKRATRVILDLMRRYHYRKVSVDDALSERMLQRYLKSLDPNRSFFLASDIEGFDTYRSELDDALRHANLAPAFVVFKRFRQRMLERAQAAVKLLDYEFDFNRNETYQFGREEAPWATTANALDELWRKRVKNDILELRLAGRKADEIRDTLTQRYARMGRRITQLNANDVYQFFVNAYTVSIEPHTAYFSPRTSENFKIRMSLSLEGIGAALQTENEFTVVRRIIRGGPADLSKQLQIGDRVVGVSQGDEGKLVDVISWRLEDVVDLIRGPKNSTVRLQLLPAEALPGDPTKTISLIRDKINLEERAAKRSVIELGEGNDAVKVGVITVPTFYLDSTGRARGVPNYRSTTRDVRRLVKELQAEQVAGIVVDLRGNSGGSLVEATELTGLFIESGPVVQIKDARGRTQVTQDPDPLIAYRGPLAVLVDRGSASASEIFSAAIQDYHRGVILGEPTFGKGTVQNLFDLDRRGGLGQLKVTIAQFFRINGEGTQHRGVVPDIVFPTARDAKSQGERGLDNALPWASIKPASYKPVVSRQADYSQARLLHQQRVRQSPQFQLLLEEIASAERFNGIDTISLLEEERKREWEQRKSERESREKRLRQTLGQPEPKPTGDSAPSAGGPPTPSQSAPDEPEGAGEGNDGDRKDILLQEAARILVDIFAKSAAQPGSKVADSAGVSFARDPVRPGPRSPGAPFATMNADP